MVQERDELLVLAALGKISPGTGKTILKILVGERFDADDLVFSGSMDEIPVSGVDPHMRDPVSVLAEEKDQVTSVEVFL
jgi:hypothetical protein